MYACVCVHAHVGVNVCEGVCVCCVCADQMINSRDFKYKHITIQRFFFFFTCFLGKRTQVLYQLSYLCSLLGHIQSYFLLICLGRL